MYIKLYRKRYQCLCLGIMILAYFCCLTSCKKFVETNTPKNSLTSDVVFSDDATAASVLTGIYARISADNPLSLSSAIVNGVSVRAGLSADELSLFGGFSSLTNWAKPYYLNSLSSAEIGM